MPCVIILTKLLNFNADFCCMKKIKPLYLFSALGLLGAAGGFLYWNFWGCTEFCPLQSNPGLSMLRGTLIGLCLAAIVIPSTKSNENPS